MVSHATVHALELSIPILMTRWLLEFSISTAELGVVVAVGYALFGIGALPAGVLVDRLGSRPLIIGCLGGMGLAFLALSRAPGPAVITLALAAWGLAASVYHPAGLALVSNAVSRRGVGLGYHGMAGNAGIAFGPLLTILLLTAFDWRTVAIGLAIPGLLAALAGLFISFDETAAVGDVSRSRSVLAGSRRIFSVGFLLVLAIVVCNGLYYRGVLTFLPDVLAGFVDEIAVLETETASVGQYLYAGLLTVGIGGQFVGGQLADRLRLEYILIGLFVGLISIAVVFVPAASGGFASLAMVSVALGFVMFAMQPVIQSTVAAHTPAGARGLSFGFVYVAAFGVGAAGAALVGAALTYGTTSTAFMLVAGIDTVGLVLAVTLLRIGQPVTDTDELSTG